MNFEKSQYDSLDEMFSIIVESIINQKNETSNPNIIVLIILAKRIISKLKIETKSKLVMLLCDSSKSSDQSEERDDQTDSERVNFLIEYVTSIINVEEVDLLLLTITLVEMTSSKSPIVKNFLMENFGKIVLICERVLSSQLAISSANQNLPSAIVKLFIPFGRFAPNLSILKPVQSEMDQTSAFKAEYFIPEGSNGTSIFTVLASHPNDRFENIYICNILNIMCESMGNPSPEDRQKFSSSFETANALFKSSLAFSHDNVDELFDNVAELFSQIENYQTHISHRIVECIIKFTNLNTTDEKNLEEGRFQTFFG